MATFVKCDWQGQKLCFDFESITAREYKVIKRHTGLKMGEFEKAFGDADRSGGIDIEVIDCLLWLFLKRAGKAVDPETMDDYNPVEFMSTFGLMEEAKTEEAPLAPGAEPKNES